MKAAGRLGGPLIGSLPSLKNLMCAVDQFPGIVLFMTFVLFLASMAVLEYILRGEQPSRQTTEIKEDRTKNSTASNPPADSGLLSLAQAIERQGSGQPVGTLDHQETLRKEGVDREARSR